MRIRDADVERVREATDLVALISRRVSLKRVGSGHVGLCPFHTEKTPSFHVDSAKGLYHCFGCKASGNVFTFLRETEHLDFIDAVERLAAAANIPLTYDSPRAQRTQSQRKELLDLLERAARFYHELLMSSPDAGGARAYLRRRGYDRQTVVKWRLGYAPARWDELCRHLGAPAAHLSAAGLAYEQPQRSAQVPRTEASDFFRDRVMFPICDAGGRVVSFAGRLLPRLDEPAPKGPKYKNTAATAVYDKSKVLYGLHLASQSARKADRIVVCEGYTDVIGCDLAGIPETVATCGTALTQQHAKLLSRSAKRIVLAFDADAAGQTAAERVHQWEREYELDIFVASLPEGSDPGDLASSDPPALRRALSEALPLRAFRADRILARADLTSPAGRDRAADEVAEVFAVYPPEVLLEADLAPAAQGIPMDVEKFRDRVDAARHRLRERVAAQQQRAATSRYEVPDYHYEDEGYSDDHGDDHGDDDAYGAYGDEGDYGYDTVSGTRASASHRRLPQQRKTDAQRQLAADVELLAAAASPHSDVQNLIVPELFATSAGRQAFAQMTQSQITRQTAGTQQAADTGEDNPGEDDTGGPDTRGAGDTDVISQMLATAADESTNVDAELAKDTVATAWLHFVRATLKRISSTGDLPRLQLNPSQADENPLGSRDRNLRWLREREPLLTDFDRRIGVAQELRDWLCGLGEAATDDAPTQDSPTQYSPAQDSPT